MLLLLNSTLISNIKALFFSMYTQRMQLHALLIEVYAKIGEEG